MPWSTDAKNSMLDALTINRVRAHSGDPGPAGTDNALGSLTAAVFDAASNGERALNADVTLTGLGASASVTHISVWDSTGPVFHGSSAVTFGDTEADASGEYTLKSENSLVGIQDPA